MLLRVTEAVRIVLGGGLVTEGPREMEGGA